MVAYGYVTSVIGQDQRGSESRTLAQSPPVEETQVPLRARGSRACGKT